MKYYALALSLLIACGQAEAKTTVAVFDSPVKKEVVPLPHDPKNPDQTAKVSCFYYPAFMIKEVDKGEKGAEKLSITPLKNQASVPCQQDNTEEMEIQNWAGYFAGVKGSYVFFDADDGINGGNPFAVFSAKTGKKLFEDSRAKNFDSVQLSGDDIKLHYRRVYSASCSLYADTPKCWDTIKRETNIAAALPAPNCAKAYLAERKRNPEHAKEIVAYPSMIGYETEAVYVEGKLTFTDASGKVSCWLPD